jgi:16S rRNA (cytosine967-C5)-methyltransferase
VANVSSARHAAFRILLAVEAGKGHSDDLLRGAAVSALAPVDRNLVTALVLGVLRWQLQLDAALRPLLARPNARLDAEVLIALRLGAFQLLHMDRIPARAAIDESVELTKESGHRFAARMVNAVLRKLVAEYAEKPRHGPESRMAHGAMGRMFRRGDDVRYLLPRAIPACVNCSPRRSSCRG